MTNFFPNTQVPCQQRSMPHVSVRIPNTLPFQEANKEINDQFLQNLSDHRAAVIDWSMAVRGNRFNSAISNFRFLINRCCLLNKIHSYTVPDCHFHLAELISGVYAPAVWFRFIDCTRFGRWKVIWKPLSCGVVQTTVAVGCVSLLRQRYRSIFVVSLLLLAL